MVFPRPLFIIIFRPEMLKFHPYSILTGDTRVEFVIYCVLNMLGNEWRRYRPVCGIMVWFDNDIRFYPFPLLSFQIRLSSVATTSLCSDTRGRSSSLSSLNSILESTWPWMWSISLKQPHTSIAFNAISIGDHPSKLPQIHHQKT